MKPDATVRDHKQQHPTINNIPYRDGREHIDEEESGSVESIVSDDLRFVTVSWLELSEIPMPSAGEAAFMVCLIVLLLVFLITVGR